MYLRLRARLIRRLTRHLTWQVHHLPNDTWRVEATWPSRRGLRSWWSPANPPRTRGLQ